MHRGGGDSSPICRIRNRSGAYPDLGAQRISVACQRLAPPLSLQTTPPFPLPRPHMRMLKYVPCLPMPAALPSRRRVLSQCSCGSLAHLILCIYVGAVADQRFDDLETTKVSSFMQRRVAILPRRRRKLGRGRPTVPCTAHARVSDPEPSASREAMTHSPCLCSNTPVRTGPRPELGLLWAQRRKTQMCN